MPSSASPAATRVAAGATAGVAFGVHLQVVGDLWGAGPVAIVGGSAFTALGLALIPPLLSRIGLAGVMVAATFFLSIERIAGGLAPGVDPRTSFLVVDIVAATLLGIPFAKVRGGFDVWARLLAAAIGGATFLMPREYALVVAVLIAGAAGRAPPAEPAPWSAAPLRPVLAGLVLTQAVTAWALLRSPLDPTLAGWLCMAVATAVGSAASGRPGGALGLVLIGAVWGAWVEGPTWIDAHLERLAGPLVSLVVGLGAGAAIGALRPGRGLGLTASLAPIVLVWVLPSFSGALGPSSRALATFGENATARARVDALRASAADSTTTFGPHGTAAIWSRDGRVFAELDGTAADPTSRAGDAEGFAGTLGACLTGGRARARVGGDDLVLATRAVAAQGFRTIDVAVPDRAFARAHAALVPSASTTWLRPTVRAVSAPAPFVVRLGAPADLVVEIARAGWTDARNVVPDRRGFEAVHRSLEPGGVYVLALGTTRLAEGDFGRIVHDLLASFEDVTVWSPPAGADTALLVARDPGPPVPWAQIVACVEADRDALRALAVRAPEDIGGRLIGDRSVLSGVAAVGRPPIGLPLVSEDPSLPLLDLDASGFDPVTWFGADAPVEVLRTRHRSQQEFFGLLRDRDAATIQTSISRARMLGAENSQVIGTLIHPHLERARGAMIRAAAEGIGSHAWQEAETAITNAELIAPGYPETACARGRLAELKNDFRNAEDAFKACVAGDPENRVGLDGVARLARARGDLATAETVLRKAYSLDPDSVSAVYNLGQLLYVRGNYDEAERLLRAASRLAAGRQPPVAAPNITLAYLYLTTRRPELALAEAERAKALDPGAEPRMLAGAARLEQGDLRGADIELRAALAVDPDNAAARGELGRVQARAGQYALAAESFKAVLEREPGNVGARENLRQVQAALGTPEAP